VQQGALRIYYVTPEGRGHATVEPGQSCILRSTLVRERAVSPWVEADRGQTHVAVVPGRVFRELFTSEMAIQKFTFEALSSRLFDLMARLEHVSTHGVEQRLARLLLKLGAETGGVSLSQERIAQHLGTAREVVSRSLRSLASRGLVSLNPGYIALRSNSGLVTLAGENVEA
jgi:CRP/FNR family transcriptional regulator